jgi:hypothetical protein
MPADDFIPKPNSFNRTLAMRLALLAIGNGGFPRAP